MRQRARATRLLFVFLVFAFTIALGQTYVYQGPEGSILAELRFTRGGVLGQIKTAEIDRVALAVALSENADLATVRDPLSFAVRLFKILREETFSVSGMAYGSTKYSLSIKRTTSNAPFTFDYGELDQIRIFAQAFGDSTMDLPIGLVMASEVGLVKSGKAVTLSVLYHGGTRKQFVLKQSTVQTYNQGVEGLRRKAEFLVAKHALIGQINSTPRKLVQGPSEELRRAQDAIDNLAKQQQYTGKVFKDMRSQLAVYGAQVEKARAIAEKQTGALLCSDQRALEDMLQLGNKPMFSSDFSLVEDNRESVKLIRSMTEKFAAHRDNLSLLAEQHKQLSSTQDAVARVVSELQQRVSSVNREIEALSRAIEAMQKRKDDSSDLQILRTRIDHLRLAAKRYPDGNKEAEKLSKQALDLLEKMRVQYSNERAKEIATLRASIGVLNQIKSDALDMLALAKQLLDDVKVARDEGQKLFREILEKFCVSDADLKAVLSFEDRVREVREILTSLSQFEDKTQMVHRDLGILDSEIKSLEAFIESLPGNLDSCTTDLSKLGIFDALSTARSHRQLAEEVLESLQEMSIRIGFVGGQLEAGVRQVEALADDLEKRSRQSPGLKGLVIALLDVLDPTIKSARAALNEALALRVSNALREASFVAKNLENRVSKVERVLSKVFSTHCSSMQAVKLVIPSSALSRAQAILFPIDKHLMMPSEMEMIDEAEIRGSLRITPPIRGIGTIGLLVASRFEVRSCLQMALDGSEAIVFDDGLRMYVCGNEVPGTLVASVEGASLQLKEGTADSVAVFTLRVNHQEVTRLQKRLSGDLYLAISLPRESIPAGADKNLILVLQHVRYAYWLP